MATRQQRRADADEEVAEPPAQPARHLGAAKLPKRRAERPPALRGGLVADVRGAGDLVGPGDHPLARRPCADHGNRADGDAHQGEAEQPGAEQLAQRRRRSPSPARDASHAGDSGSATSTTMPRAAGAPEPEHPPPRVRRDRPDACQLREQEDARVQAGHHRAGDQRPRGLRPAFRHQGDAVGPQPAHAQADQEPRRQHLLLGAERMRPPREDRVEQDAHPMARVRPMRSPRLPSATPPIAAPSISAAVNRANQSPPSVGVNARRAGSSTPTATRPASGPVPRRRRRARPARRPARLRGRGSEGPYVHEPRPSGRP